MKKIFTEAEQDEYIWVLDILLMDVGFGKMYLKKKKGRLKKFQVIFFFLHVIGTFGKLNEI